MDRIRQAQEEERWIANLEVYLAGAIATLNAEEAKVCTAIAGDYEVDDNGLLYFCTRSASKSEDRTDRPIGNFENVAAQFYVSLTCKFEGRTPKIRQNVSKNPINFPLVFVARSPRTKDQKELRKLIWKSRHLLMGSGGPRSADIDPEDPDRSTSIRSKRVQWNFG